MDQTKWNLSVDRNIVKLLSAATYENFPDALRELVSNAYDADATSVRIEINVKKDYIEVSDDGIGMTPEEFGFFLRIAGKRSGRNVSPELGRIKIGQFGIGFLSVFPFGRNIFVASTALRSDIRFEAVIAASRYIDPSKRAIDVQDLDVPGTVQHDKKFLRQHGTTIRIVGLTDLAKSFFDESRRRNRREKASVLSWNVMEQLYWKLSEDLPVQYPRNSLLRSAFKDFESSGGFRVFLNGNEILRNSPGHFVLENDMWSYGNVKCRYVIATDWGSVIPEEDRHFKIRLRNVGIGKRTSFDLGRLGRSYSRLHWLTGEIRIVKGLDNLLSIDRTRFVEGGDYDAFSDFFRSKLSHYANYVETVAVAERDINRQLSESKAAEVGSKKQIIEEKIDTLASKGFKIQRVKRGADRENKAPVSVDFSTRTVEYVEDHPKLNDTINVSGKNIEVIYETSQGGKANSFVIKRNKQGALVINESYKLFGSRRYGEVIKKIFLNLYLLIEESDTDLALLSTLARRLEKELADIGRKGD